MWHLGDLMRRMSMFKSITWFAKPKVVDAVNCARRGWWVNAEMNVIAWEACGARILFSTPSSSTQQQVEKAALVFCLKLNNGHTLLCLWLYNACDENLAQFPPTRFQLRALPVISSAAVQSMRTPRLEQFFRLSLPLEMCDSSLLAAEKATPSNNRYDKVIKLISLFGWKPLALPYMVVGKNANVCSSPRSPPEKAEEVVIPNFSNIGQNPRSVVLYCELCGASVGIWGFSTISWPMEMFRLAGFTELNKGMISGSSPDGKNSDNRNVISGSSSGYPTSKETVSNINQAGIVGFDASSQNEDIHKDEPAVVGVSDRIKEKNVTLVVQVCNLEVLSSSEEASITDKEPSAHKDALEEEMTGHRKQLSEDISEEGVIHFDPVRQHRPFCPWIASSGRGVPGWQQTLSSLLHQEEDSDSMLMRSPFTSFLRVTDTPLVCRY